MSKIKFNRLTNQKNFHRYRNNPTPRVTTYNTTSYSHDQTAALGYQRQLRVTANLESFAGFSDFILVQETKSNKESPIYRKLLRPKFKVYNNPNPDPDHIKEGGTDIFVSQLMIDNFDIRHETPVKGYMQALFLTPKNQDSLFLVPFTILNVYLLSGSDAKI